MIKLNTVCPHTSHIFSKFFPCGCKVLAVATPTTVELHQPACPTRCYGTGEVVTLETDHTNWRVIVEGTFGRVCGGRRDRHMENCGKDQQTIHSLHTFVGKKTRPQHDWVCENTVQLLYTIVMGRILRPGVVQYSLMHDVQGASHHNTSAYSCTAA